MRREKPRPWPKEGAAALRIGGRGRSSGLIGRWVSRCFIRVFFLRLPLALFFILFFLFLFIGKFGLRSYMLHLRRRK